MAGDWPPGGGWQTGNGQEYGGNFGQTVGNMENLGK